MTDSQTIPDVHSIARDQLRAFVQRVERIEEEIKTLNDDKSDIYKEAAAVGFDKKTLKKVVARRKVDDSQRQEEDALFEMYWNAVHGTNLVHARVRENIEEFDAETGEILEDSRSDSGLNIVTKHTEITASPETATIPSSEQSEGNGSRDHQHVHSRQTDGAKHGGQDGEPAGADHAINPEMDRATEGSFETGSEAAEKGREAIPAGPEGADLSHAGAGESPATEKATVATQGEATAPTSDERVSLPVDDRSDAAANAGGDHVDGNALRVPTSVTGEGAASALPAKPKVSFRPNCQHPENCASGTRDHCWSCRRAMQKSEEMA